MIKTDMFKRKDGALLVVYLCNNGDLIGIVYMDGNEKRGHHDLKARFSKKQNEATIYRVKESFYFTNENSFHWWKRWA